MIKNLTISAIFFIAGPSVSILNSKGIDGSQFIVITGGDISPPGGVVEWERIIPGEALRTT